MRRSSPSAAARSIPRGAGLLVVALLAALPALPAPAATITWINPAGGSWSDPANWSPSQVPTAPGDDAVLPALSGPYRVTLDVNLAIDALQIDANDPTLDLNGFSIAAVPAVNNSGTIRNLVGIYDSSRIHNLATGTIVTPDGVVQASGILWNYGTIVLGPGTNSALVSPSGLVLDGGGTLILNGTPIVDPGAGQLIIRPGSTVRGASVIGKSIANSGTLESDGALGATLRVDAIVYNYGTIRVSHNGLFHVNRPLMKNVGGTVTSGPGGGTFDVMTSSGVGGLLDNTSGLLVADGGDLMLDTGTLMNGEVRRVGDTGAVKIGIATLQNLTVAAGAELSVPGHADLMAANSALTNNGTVRVSGSINFGIIDAPDSISIAGTGVVVLEGGVLGTGTGAPLVNRPGQTIQGCGTINPPFANYGTVNFDCGSNACSVTGVFVNRNVVRVRSGSVTIRGVTSRFVNRGTVSVTGGRLTLDQNATLDNAGGVLAADGGVVSLGGSTTATLLGGRLDASGGGLFQVAKAATLTDATLGPSATLLTLGGATTTASGAKLANQGTVRLETGGRLVVAPATDYVQTAGATVLEGGAISAGRDLQIQAGRLCGAGTITANVVSGGDVQPDPVGDLRIQGDFRQLPGGTFHVALAGEREDQISRLVVTGAATLDGAIATAAAAGFTPAAGNSFSVLSYGSVSGRFGPLLSRSAGAPLDITPIYGTDALTLVINGTTGVGGMPAPAAIRFYGRRESAGASFVLELPDAAEIRGRVYDTAGREVARLGDGPRPAGVHVFTLDRPGGVATGLSSGVYFASVTITRGAAHETRTARAVVLR